MKTLAGMLAVSSLVFSAHVSAQAKDADAIRIGRGAPTGAARCRGSAQRPWAQIWEKYREKGMQKPEREDIFEFK